MEAGTGTYNVGGALEASMNEAIALLERIAGRSLDLRRSDAVAGDQRRTSADTSRIRAELGWVPPSGSTKGSQAMGVGVGYSRRAVTTPPAPDPDAEREVDLARWRRAVVRLWWLPVGGLVLGAIVGVLYSLRGGTDYKASALISLGQPVSPGGALVNGFDSNPRAIALITSSASAQSGAEAKAGMRAGALRGHVSVARSDRRREPVRRELRR